MQFLPNTFKWDLLEKFFDKSFVRVKIFCKNKIEKRMNNEIDDDDDDDAMFQYSKCEQISSTKENGNWVLVSVGLSVDKIVGIHISGSGLARGMIRAGTVLSEQVQMVSDDLLSCVYSRSSFTYGYTDMHICNYDLEFKLGSKCQSFISVLCRCNANATKISDWLIWVTAVRPLNFGMVASSYAKHTFLYLFTVFDLRYVFRNFSILMATTPKINHVGNSFLELSATFEHLRSLNRCDTVYTVQWLYGTESSYELPTEGILFINGKKSQSAICGTSSYRTSDRFRKSSVKQTTTVSESQIWFQEHRGARKAHYGNRKVLRNGSKLDQIEIKSSRLMDGNFEARNRTRDSSRIGTKGSLEVRNIEKLENPLTMAAISTHHVRNKFANFPNGGPSGPLEIVQPPADQEIRAHWSADGNEARMTRCNTEELCEDTETKYNSKKIKGKEHVEQSLKPIANLNLAIIENTAQQLIIQNESALQHNAHHFIDVLHTPEALTFKFGTPHIAQELNLVIEISINYLDLADTEVSGVFRRSAYANVREKRNEEGKLGVSVVEFIYSQGNELDLEVLTTTDGRLL
ncbi:hypothetical protein WN51_01604 [Melipona quadrifasciata]|uniref:Uncharacterized protein n=1 Tax=Melipona quadrifasciata TaxID=166423 RepID=A0A0N0BE40_9HYME|nr:hypothetical protein WN51_01604 [Melipona quadrifasciata]